MSDQTSVTTPPVSPWLTIKQAAPRAQVTPKTLYKEIKAKRLKAARIGSRRELRVRVEWIDQWLEASVPSIESV